MGIPEPVTETSLRREFGDALIDRWKEIRDDLTPLSRLFSLEEQERLYFLIYRKTKNPEPIGPQWRYRVVRITAAIPCPEIEEKNGATHDVGEWARIGS